MSNSDKLWYAENPLELVSSFVYLGVNLSTRITTSAHLQRLESKGIGATNMLQTKASENDVIFSALRLYHAITIPAATNGLSLFGTETEENTYVQHIDFIAGYYWKKWAQLPSNSPTTRLRTRTFENDHLNIQKSKLYNRRRIAKYYTNVNHELLCHKTHCYKLEKHDVEAERGFTGYEACKCKK